jgi:hypothetical protein
MNQSVVTKNEIIAELDALPPESFSELRAFIEFLRFKRGKYGDWHVEQTRQEMWQTALQATFGMWADRDDVADDGVGYVQDIRQGHRCGGDCAL